MHCNIQQASQMSTSTTHVVFLVDNSGSMEVENRIQMVFEAVRKLLQCLLGMAGIVASLVTFDDTFKVRFERPSHVFGEGFRACLENKAVQLYLATCLVAGGQWTEICRPWCRTYVRQLAPRALGDICRRWRHSGACCRVV